MARTARTALVGGLLLASAPGAAASFRFSDAQQFPAGAGPWFMVASDLNRDGRPDLAVTNTASLGPAGVSLLVNGTARRSGLASFTPGGSLRTGRSPQAIASADFDGDGRRDLAVGNIFTSDSIPLTGPGLLVFVNRTAAGSSDLRFADPVGIKAGYGPEVLASADFNGDGRPDLAFSNYGTPAPGTSDVSVILNRTPRPGRPPVFTARAAFRVGSQPIGVSPADVNGDGRPDLVVANNFSYDVSVLLNRTPTGASEPSFSAAVNFPAGGPPIGPETLETGDLNRDGRPDIVTPNFSSAHGVSVLFNTTPRGAGTPSFTPKFDYDAGVGPQHIAIRNFDGDRRPDIAVANYGSVGSGALGGVSLFENRTATGADRPALAAPASFGAGRGPTALAAADYNRDRRIDLAVSNNLTNGVGGVSVLLNEVAPSQALQESAPTRGCLTQRSPIGPRNIGRIRLGYSRRRLLRLPVEPVRRTRRSYRYCVKRSRGRVTALFSSRSRRGRVRLVSTTARGHGNRRVRVGSRAGSFRRAYPNRGRVARELYRANPRSPRLFGLRAGRVRFIAVADRRLLGRSRTLRRYLRLAGL